MKIKPIAWLRVIYAGFGVLGNDRKFILGDWGKVDPPLTIVGKTRSHGVHVPAA